jgi:ABC-type nitrate/sulfonate/bicarbonate transport system substrate-binding protein
MRERHNATFRSIAHGSAAFSAVRRRARGLSAVTAIVALGLTLAGCGGGSGGAGRVTIGKAVDTIGFTTVDVADGKGYFEKAGVNVKSTLLGGSSTAFAALQSGSVQFVTASSSAFLGAKAQGLPLQAVTGLDYGLSLQLVASNKWLESHHMAPNQPTDKVMAGLVGATLGVISNTDLTYYHLLMQQAGVDPSQFKTITFKTQDAMLAAAQHGQIDAFLLSPPNSYVAESQGFAKIIANLHAVRELSDMTYDILVVESGWAKSHPDVVKAVATAMAKADNVMAKDPNSVLDVEKKHFSTMSDDVLLNSLKNVTFTPDGKMTPEGWNSAKDVAAQSGVKGAAGVNVASDGDIWTNSYISTPDLR